MGEKNRQDNTILNVLVGILCYFHFSVVLLISKGMKKEGIIEHFKNITFDRFTKSGRRGDLKILLYMRVPIS